MPRLGSDDDAPLAHIAPLARIDGQQRYRVLGPLGRGGMGAVYLARALGVGGFQRLVVMKRLHAELAGDPAVVRMFLDEARLCAALSHPHIVQVIDVGRDDDGVYLVMEHLHGFDLMTVLRRAARRGRGLPLPIALHLVQAACRGLHHAHEARDGDGQPLELVHRDVSPHNVIATFEGEVKVIDFGIAKARDRLGGTRTGAIKGKLGYMSPEQCRGRPVDRRSDVFGLGILLLELSTGRRLFVGRDDYELLRAIVEDPLPRPTALVAGYPAELEHIALRALAAEPQQRYATALALCEALDEVAARHGAATARDLAALMNELFGEELARFQGARGDELLPALTPPRDPEAPALREVDTRRLGAPPGAPPTKDVGPATATASPAVSFAPRRRWRRWLPATLAAAALAAAARWGIQASAPPQVAPAPAGAPPTTTVAAPAPSTPSASAAPSAPSAPAAPSASGPTAPIGQDPIAAPAAAAPSRLHRRLRPDAGRDRRAARESAPATSKAAPPATEATAPSSASPATRPAPPPALPAAPGPSAPPGPSGTPKPRAAECVDDDCVL